MIAILALIMIFIYFGLMIIVPLVAGIIVYSIFGGLVTALLLLPFIHFVMDPFITWMDKIIGWDC